MVLWRTNSGVAPRKKCAGPVIEELGGVGASLTACQNSVNKATAGKRGKLGKRLGRGSREV